MKSTNILCIVGILVTIVTVILIACFLSNCECKPQAIEKYNYKNTLLAVRSYNRPEYLSSTLASLHKSDIDSCYDRIIYDDSSTESDTLNLLDEAALNKNKDKQFTVVRNKKNVGVGKSYINLLKYIKKHYASDIRYVVIMDNDVEVKHNFLSTMRNVWQEAAEELDTKMFVLSGYKSTAPQHNDADQTEYKNFVTKFSTGAVCYFFHIDFIDAMLTGWKQRQDWGISELIKRTPGYHFCVVKTGVVNHIGAFGTNNNGGDYDKDVSFEAVQS